MHPVAGSGTSAEAELSAPRKPPSTPKADDQSFFGPTKVDVSSSYSDFSYPAGSTSPPPPPKPKAKGKVAKKAAPPPKSKTNVHPRRGAVAKPKPSNLACPMKSAATVNTSSAIRLKRVVREMVIPKVGRCTIVDGKVGRLLKLYKD